MISVLQLVVQFATVIIASVFQNAYQDAINAIVTPAFAAQLIAAILVAAFAFALHANAILEEDAFLHAITFVTMIVKSKYILYNIIFLDKRNLII